MKLAAVCKSKYLDTYTVTTINFQKMKVQCHYLLLNLNFSRCVNQCRHVFSKKRFYI